MDINTPEGMEAAAAWTSSLIARLKPGGSWGVPRCGGLYTFDQELKMYSVTGAPDADIDRVLAHMGWSCTGVEPLEP